MSLALHTDRYQLTMLAAYARTGLAERRAAFELFVRRLPPSRRFLVACGVGRAVEALRELRFSSDDLAWLEADSFLGPAFRHRSVRDLFERFRFRGRVLAVPEGRVCFPGEPLLRVEGTLAEAQLVETLLLSIINHDTRVASKCARIVLAARGRDCFEFGTRRTHEHAAVAAARAAWIAGFAGTSNEEAARRWGVPVSGTMAHAFVLAHAADHGEEGERASFEAFAETFEVPATALVDTFDTLRGVDRAIAASNGARTSRPSIGGVRIDSGDLATLALHARTRLDVAGMAGTRIVLSDDLDEHRIDALTRGHVPVDAFGVGTMAVATPDAPSLGAVYKLVALEDAAGRLVAVQKRSSGKGSSAGPKQVFRSGLDDAGLEDVVGVDGEPLPGEPVLQEVFGPRVGVDLSAAAARARCAADLALLPARLRSIDPRGGDEDFPVRKSAALTALHDTVDREGRAVL
ncbi:MAG: nicotinate phosphoribosyltransferase [Deltaproteobacteria bacterium]|nr:nicotinate phosphoribosyltransferase [Deltaproteobacteria bacterium]